jgi:hypothetical protein
LSEAIPVAFARRRWAGRRDPRRAAGHRSDQAQPAGDPAFTKFNQRNTPEIGGEVKRIGADLPRDDKSSPGYFVVSIVAPPDELARARRCSTAVGMPAMVVLQTSERTLLSY